MLEQILYLLEPTLIGKRTYSATELVDVGGPERARAMQDQAIGMVVADAPLYARYLAHARSEGDEFPDGEAFLNRIVNFPLEMRTPEWEALVAELKRYQPDHGHPQFPFTVVEPPKPKRTRKQKGATA
ncbi:hypothetical protein GC163_12545 [bacterium]|nr:hypothetical protein [bacterium]